MVPAIGIDHKYSNIEAARDAGSSRGDHISGTNSAPAAARL